MPITPSTTASKAGAPLAIVPPPAETSQSSPVLFRLGDLLAQWEVDAAAAFDARTRGIPRGPISGFPHIDKELGGAFSPGLHVIHGQPGTGKTAFTLQVAAGCGCPCLYITCEMAPLELLRRHTARVTKTFLGRLKSGELAPADSLALAKKACAAAPQLALVDATQAFASPAYLRDSAIIARGDAAHLLVVVDSLHSWAESIPGQATEYETLNAGLVALRQLSHELRCPVVAVAERNRGSMNSGGLSAGAGTRKIEYGAETVLDLERDPAKREDAAGEVEVMVKFAKNRHGAAGKKVELLFHGGLQKFRETV